MKKFICTITLQVMGAEKHHYADMSGKNTERVLTAFPIIQQISDVVTKGETIKIIATVVEKENNSNYTAFLDELEVLKEKIGFEYEIAIIEKPNNEKIDTIIELFAKISNHIEDGDTLYACLTYGTKPVSTITTMALHYAYRIKKDVTVGAVIYGQKNWGSAIEPKCELYDTTSLFYIDLLIDRIANMKVEDPEAALKMLLDMGEN